MEICHIVSYHPTKFVYETYRPEQQQTDNNQNTPPTTAKAVPAQLITYARCPVLVLIP